MNNGRRLLTVAGASAFLPTLSGCSSTPSFPEYDERVNSVLLSPQGNQLVVLGEKFHYVFHDAHALNAVLRSSFHRQITGVFDEFDVYGDNNIRGRYRLMPNLPLNPQQTKEATDLGFKVMQDGSFQLNGILIGKRYSPSDVGSEIRASSLNRTYVVKVRDRIALSARSLESSPVRRAADGALTIFLFPLIAIFAIFAIKSCPACR